MGTPELLYLGVIAVALYAAYRLAHWAIGRVEAWSHHRVERDVDNALHRPDPDFWGRR